MGRVKISVDGYRCERCEYQWIPRKIEYPKVCPRCKSPYWDKPRKKGIHADAKKLKDSKA